ncbi:J domain-containing protein [Methylobacterium oryzae CBMB20]
MTQEEAYEILGLQRGATAEQIRSAHRSLMKRAHPDQGAAPRSGARQRGPGQASEPTSLNSTRVVRELPIVGRGRTRSRPFCIRRAGAPVGHETRRAGAPAGLSSGWRSS